MMKNKTERDVQMAGETLQIPTPSIFLYKVSNVSLIEFDIIRKLMAYIFLNAVSSRRPV